MHLFSGAQARPGTQAARDSCQPCYQDSSPFGSERHTRSDLQWVWNVPVFSICRNSHLVKTDFHDIAKSHVKVSQLCSFSLPKRPVEGNPDLNLCFSCSWSWCWWAGARWMGWFDFDFSKQPSRIWKYSLGFFELEALKRKYCFILPKASTLLSSVSL